jgi:hypothetical protein
MKNLVKALKLLEEYKNEKIEELNKTSQSTFIYHHITDEIEDIENFITKYKLKYFLK